MRSTKAIRCRKTSYIILSALFIVLGVGLIALRDLSVSLIGIAAGVMLIVFGLVKLGGLFHPGSLPSWRFSTTWRFGLLLVALGVMHAGPARPRDELPVPDIGHRHHGRTACSRCRRRCDARRFGLKTGG